MNHPLLYAALVCAVAALGEGLFMGTEGAKFLRRLRQPRYSPPAWAWSLVGIAYYSICFFAIYRLTCCITANRVPLVLLLGLMAANTFWNFVFFRLRDLRAAFWYSIIYCVLAIALLMSLLGLDKSTLLAFSAYVAYLPYAVLISYRTWKLNA